MSAADVLARAGLDRVLEPAGALPQAAWRLDASGPGRAHELTVGVEALHLDATSFRQLREAAGGDPARIAQAVEAIVGERGKMHNPQTGSGGILVGRVEAAGAAVADGPAPGTRVATLASLSLTPLRLDAVGPIDPSSPEVPVEGTAYVAAGTPWASVPDDLPLPLVLAVLDVYGAPSHTRRLARPGDRVLVLGGGRAGLLSLAAARDAGAAGYLVDVHEAACERARALGLCELAVAADLQDAARAVELAAAAGLPPADLTVVVVDAPGCEASAALLTRDDGRVLFFSMATSFTAAALLTEGLGSAAELVIGCGYARDRGAYALSLVRANPALATAMG